MTNLCDSDLCERAAVAALYYPSGPLRVCPEHLNTILDEHADGERFFRKNGGPWFSAEPVAIRWLGERCLGTGWPVALCESMTEEEHSSVSRMVEAHRRARTLSGATQLIRRGTESYGDLGRRLLALDYPPRPTSGGA